MLKDIGTRIRSFEAAGHVVRYFEVSDVDAAIERAIEKNTIAPYGAVPWASAFVMTEMLACMHLDGRTVVDVGAGCGVVSLMASKLGARVIALEIDELARQLLEQAAKEQDLRIDVRPFDIAGGTSLPEGELFIFADLLYETDLASHTAHRCIEAIERGENIWVGDPQRSGRAVFQDLMRDAGHECIFCENSYQDPDLKPLQRIGVYTHCPGGWADVW